MLHFNNLVRRSYSLNLRKPWQWALIGCVALPVQLSTMPGICQTLKPSPRTALTKTFALQSVPARVTPTTALNRSVSAQTLPVYVAQQPIAAANLQAMEARVQSEINQIRRSKGLSPLSSNSQLAQVARGHSQNMASRSFFSHTDPSGRNSFERVKGAGIQFRYMAENIAWNLNTSDPVIKAVQGWMNSSSHRKNILRPNLEETGVGVVRRGNRYYFTQLFLRN